MKKDKIGEEMFDCKNEEKVYKAVLIFTTALFGLSIILTSSNVYAKKKKPMPQGISKAFHLACEKRSIEDPINDFRAVIDKEGKPRCQGYKKYAKPHCPKGYRVIKGKCRNSSSLN